MDRDVKGIVAMICLTAALITNLVMRGPDSMITSAIIGIIGMLGGASAMYQLQGVEKEKK